MRGRRSGGSSRARRTRRWRSERSARPFWPSVSPFGVEPRSSSSSAVRSFALEFAAQAQGTAPDSQGRPVGAEQESRAQAAGPLEQLWGAATAAVSRAGEAEPAGASSPVTRASAPFAAALDQAKVLARGPERPVPRRCTPARQESMPAAAKGGRSPLPCVPSAVLLATS